MKTRRILAASTAALLAFGTTAAYVASAADGVKVTKGYGDIVLGAGDKAKIDAVMEKVSVSIKNTTITVKLDGTKAEMKAMDVASVNGGGDGTVLYPVSFRLSGATAAAGDTDDEWAKPQGDNTTQLWLGTTTAHDKVKYGGVEYTIKYVYNPEEVDLTNAADGVKIGAGVTVSVSEKDAEKLDKDEKKINLTASVSNIATTTDDKDNVVVDTDETSIVKDLSKGLKKEIGKIKAANFEIIEIDADDDGYVIDKTPVPVTIKLNLPFKANVYHVNGDSVEKLNASAKKKTDDTYDVTFTTSNFSPFIFTTANLANAKATTSDNEPTSAATSDGASTTNPDTGIALAIAPVVLAAGAVAVVALKKKH